MPDAAALTFLGLGDATPDSKLGNDAELRQSPPLDAPHLTIFPGLAIAVLVLGFDFLGDGLRDALDPATNRQT